MASTSLRTIPTIPSSAEQSPKIRVVWATDLRGRQPVRDWLDGLDELQRRHVSNLVDLLGVNGSVTIGERLCAFPRGLGVPRSVTEGLFLLRADRTVRILGGFRSGGVFVAAWGTVKRENRFDSSDIIAAKRILREHDIVSTGSAPLVAKQTPTPSPTFRPTIVPAPAPKPTAPAAESSHTTPVSLFKTTPSAEYEWALVKTDDLLPPTAPLALSMCRLPRIHQALHRDELEAYVGTKLKAMDTHSRMALGLLDDNATVLLLGAAWGVELLMTRELTQEALREPEEEPAPVAPEPGEAPKEAPASTDGPPKLYWLHAGPQFRRRRFLIEVVGDGRARTSYRTGIKIKKVLTRTYVARAGRWTSPMLKPASWFHDKNAADYDDPFVREALRRAWAK